MKFKLFTKRLIFAAGGMTIATLVACGSNLPDVNVTETGDGDAGDGDMGDGDSGDGDIGDGDGDGVVVDPGVPPNPGLCETDTLKRKRTLKPDGSNHPDAEEALALMTVDEKIDALNGGTECPGYDCDFDGTGVPSLNIKDFRMRDGPRGVHTHNGDLATTFAVAMARGASFDLELENRVGRVQGVEMRELRYDLSLSPQINTLRNPRWARAQESYSEDPFMLGKFGAAYVNGMQENVPACPKHFAMNNTDENRHDMSANADEQTLRENYTLAFKIVVEEADPGCIMAAYNDVNGTPSTENSHLLTDILRDDWGWEGFVVSDWWATTPSGGAATLNAGLDLEMPDKAAFKTLPSDLSGGAVQASRIDEAAMRILNVRGRFGQLADGYNHDNPNGKIWDTPDHKAVARETAEKGAVLLRNEGILPISPDVKSIMVMGPDADLPVTTTSTPGGPHGMGDRGSSNTNPPYAVSYLKGLTDRGAASEVTVTSSTIAADATKADLIVIPVTMQHEDEGEAFSNGGDRDDMTLSGNHPIHWNPKPAAFINEVAGYNPNVVVLLAVGSAIIVEDWAASAPGIVQTFYPGQEAGNAVAALLFGDVNFSGKLPFTVGTSEDQYPYFGNNDATLNVDFLHGYRKFETEGLTPRYWFGTGLSYTTFEYGEIELLCESSSTEGAVQAGITITNTGSVAGDEVVQAYIGYPNTAARRPVKELKAWARTGLLQPGESKKIYFNIPARDMMYWGDSGWTLENVAHDLIISASANPADPNMRKASFTLN